VVAARFDFGPTLDLASSGDGGDAGGGDDGGGSGEGRGDPDDCSSGSVEDDRKWAITNAVYLFGSCADKKAPK
jgi:hypothetical protein